MTLQILSNPVKEDKTVESEEIEEIDLGRSRSKGKKPGKVAGVDEVCPG